MGANKSHDPSMGGVGEMTVEVGGPMLASGWEPERGTERKGRLEKAERGDKREREREKGARKRGREREKEGE